MEQSFWQNNRNRNCRVAIGTVNGARPNGTLKSARAIWSVALQGDGMEDT